MTRRIPLLPTLLVLAAVGLMIALGIWQLERLQWKEALLAHYAAAADAPPLGNWPQDAKAAEAALYRHATIACTAVRGISAMAGYDRALHAGWAHIAECELAGGGTAEIVLGWSEDPANAAWSGGSASGVIGPGKGGAARLVADPPLVGLKANALPDPKDIPNNHLSYAIQWFLFAATALVIYALALRKRWRSELAAADAAL